MLCRRSASAGSWWAGRHVLEMTLSTSWTTASCKSPMVHETAIPCQAQGSRAPRLPRLQGYHSEMHRHGPGPLVRPRISASLGPNKDGHVREAAFPLYSRPGQTRVDCHDVVFLLYQLYSPCLLFIVTLYGQFTPPLQGPGPGRNMGAGYRHRVSQRCLPSDVRRFMRLVQEGDSCDGMPRMPRGNAKRSSE